MSEEKKIKRVYVTRLKDLDPTVCEEKLKGKLNGDVCEVNVIEYEDGEKEFVSAEEVEKRGLK